MAISLKVNGATRSVEAEPDTPLLYVLRNDFELNGAKFGCGLAQCGACTVLVNGVATRSCSLPISQVGTSELTTLEGLGTLAKPHPLVVAVFAAFVALQYIRTIYEERALSAAYPSEYPAYALRVPRLLPGLRG